MLAVGERDRQARRGPADRTLLEGFGVARREPDLATGSLGLPAEELGDRPASEPLGGVAADQAAPLVGGDVTVHH